MGPISLFDKLVFRFLYFITHRGVLKYFFTILLVNIFTILILGIGDGLAVGTFILVFLFLIIENVFIARDFKTEFKRCTKYQMLKKKRKFRARKKNGR